MTIPEGSAPPPGRGSSGIDLLLSAFPAGQLSEIVGPWSSGSSGLLLRLMATVTASGGQVALVDGADAFDPAVAASGGAALGRILWVKCGGRLPAAWSACDLLARCPGFALVALDLGELLADGRDRLPPSLGLRLQRAVEGTETILVLRAPRRVSGTAAALVVSMRRLDSRWIGRPDPIRFAGLISEARILRLRARRRDASGSDGLGAADGSCWVIEWTL